MAKTAIRCYPDCRRTFTNGRCLIFAYILTASVRPALCSVDYNQSVFFVVVTNLVSQPFLRLGKQRQMHHWEIGQQEDNKADNRHFDSDRPDAANQ